MRGEGGFARSSARSSVLGVRDDSVASDGARLVLGAGEASLDAQLSAELDAFNVVASGVVTSSSSRSRSATRTAGWSLG